jgi:hypothetical protein
MSWASPEKELDWRTATAEASIPISGNGLAFCLLCSCHWLAVGTLEIIRFSRFKPRRLREQGKVPIPEIFAGYFCPLGPTLPHF